MHSADPIELRPLQFSLWVISREYTYTHNIHIQKPLGAEKRTNKLNPHLTLDLGIEPGPHWWETSALTTAPSLLVELLLGYMLLSPLVVKSARHICNFLVEKKQSLALTSEICFVLIFCLVKDALS